MAQATVDVEVTPVSLPVWDGLSSDVRSQVVHLLAEMAFRQVVVQPWRVSLRDQEVRPDDRSGLSQDPA
jgi:hypothetical protein